MFPPFLPPPPPSFTHHTSPALLFRFPRYHPKRYKAGLRELEILQKLQELDKRGRHHCVRFYHHFKHRNHLCLVFEHMSLNLREVQRRYGRNKGLSLKAVQSYTHQVSPPLF